MARDRTPDPERTTGFAGVFVTPDGERYAASFPQLANQLFAVGDLR